MSGSRILQRLRRSSGRFAVLVLVSSITLPTIAGEKRGGIEIGAKGVKMTVVELANKPDEPAKVLQSAASNTTIASGVVKTKKYSADAIQETAAAAGHSSEAGPGKVIERDLDEVGPTRRDAVDGAPRQGGDAALAG